jgi:hypothetical protein
MQLEDKYLVLKRADIDGALTEQEFAMLQVLLEAIHVYRLSQGKPMENKYVVINQDEAYFPDVLKLMEWHQAAESRIADTAARRRQGALDGWALRRSRQAEVEHIQDLQRQAFADHIAAYRAEHEGHEEIEQHEQ